MFFSKGFPKYGYLFVAIFTSFKNIALCHYPLLSFHCILLEHSNTCNHSKSCKKKKPDSSQANAQELTVNCTKVTVNTTSSQTTLAKSLAGRNHDSSGSNQGAAMNSGSPDCTTKRTNLFRQTSVSLLLLYSVLPHGDPLMNHFGGPNTIGPSKSSMFFVFSPLYSAPGSNRLSVSTHTTTCGLWRNQIFRGRMWMFRCCDCTHHVKGISVTYRWRAVKDTKNPSSRSLNRTPS